MKETASSHLLVDEGSNKSYFTIVSKGEGFKVILFTDHLVHYNTNKDLTCQNIISD